MSNYFARLRQQTGLAETVIPASTATFPSHHLSSLEALPTEVPLNSLAPDQPQWAEARLPSPAPPLNLEKSTPELSTTQSSLTLPPVDGAPLPSQRFSPDPPFEEAAALSLSEPSRGILPQEPDSVQLAPSRAESQVNVQAVPLEQRFSEVSLLQQTSEIATESAATLSQEQSQPLAVPTRPPALEQTVYLQTLQAVRAWVAEPIQQTSADNNEPMLPAMSLEQDRTGTISVSPSSLTSYPPSPAINLPLDQALDQASDQALALPVPFQTSSTEATPVISIGSIQVMIEAPLVPSGSPPPSRQLPPPSSPRLNRHYLRPR